MKMLLLSLAALTVGCSSTRSACETLCEYLDDKCGLNVDCDDDDEIDDCVDEIEDGGDECEEAAHALAECIDEENPSCDVDEPECASEAQELGEEC